MKNFLLLAVILTFGASCSKTNSAEENRIIKDELIFKSSLESTIFYDVNSKLFYLVQTYHPVKLEKPVFISEIGNKSLKIKSEGKIINYELGKNGVFGFVKLGGIGNKLIENYSNLGKRTSEIVIVDDFNEKVYCKCFENKIPDNKCTSGGKGARECSQTISIPAVVTQTCDTKCDEGHYACSCCWAD